MPYGTYRLLENGITISSRPQATPFQRPTKRGEVHAPFSVLNTKPSLGANRLTIEVPLGEES